MWGGGEGLEGGGGEEGNKKMGKEEKKAGNLTEQGRSWMIPLRLLLITTLLFFLFSL